LIALDRPVKQKKSEWSSTPSAWFEGDQFVHHRRHAGQCSQIWIRELRFDGFEFAANFRWRIQLDRTCPGAAAARQVKS